MAQQKKQSSLPANFAQGTQRIARIKELTAEPVAFVIEPEPEQVEAAVDSPVNLPLSDAEVASAFQGEAPVSASRVKRNASAYTSQVIDIRPIIIVA